MKGVVIYVSDFKRSLPDKLAKNFFAEPSQVSSSMSSMSAKELLALRPPLSMPGALRHP